MRPDRVHRVTVALDGCETRRVIDVADTTTLLGLHRVLEASMGWSGEQPHEWWVDDRHLGCTAEAEWLTGALVGRRAAYRYGTAWHHTIHVAPGQRPSALPFPLLLAAEAACPPEAFDGPDAYRRALSGEDPGALPAGFDPARAELRTASSRVAALQHRG